MSTGFGIYFFNYRTMCVKFKENPLKNNSRKNRMEKHIYITREGFLRKNIVAVSFLQNCATHPYSKYIFSSKSFPFL